MRWAVTAAERQSRESRVFMSKDSEDVANHYLPFIYALRKSLRGGIIGGDSGFIGVKGQAG
jgi:hypothetical protein